MKKILCISNMYPSDRSPAFGYFVERFTDKSKFEFIYAVNKNPGKELPVLIWKYLSLTSRLVYQLFFHFDLIEVHYLIPNGILGLLAKWLRKKPLIIVVHGSDLNYLPEKNRFFFMFAKFILKRSDRIVIITFDHLELLSKKYQIPKEKIELFLIGPEVNSKTLHDLENLSVALDKIPHARKLLFIGSGQLKGQLVFVRAAKILEKRDIDFVMVVARDAERKLVKSKAAELKIERLQILPGLPHEVVMQLIATSDIIAIPSYSESVNVVGLEALWLGKPIVATPVGEIRRYLKADHNGLFIKIADARDLARAIQQIFRRYKEFAKSARNDMKNIRRIYNMKNFQRKIDKLRQDLIGSKVQ